MKKMTVLAAAAALSVLSPSAASAQTVSNDKEFVGLLLGYFQSQLTLAGAWDNAIGSIQGLSVEQKTALTSALSQVRSSIGLLTTYLNNVISRA